jgi:hypothetical protein
MSPRAPFQRVDDKKLVFVSLPSIGCNTCPTVVFSGILQSPKPLLSGDVRGTLLAHCHGHQFGHLFRCICRLLYICLMPWWHLGQWSKYSPNAGIQWLPE